MTISGIHDDHRVSRHFFSYKLKGSQVGKDVGVEYFTQQSQTVHSHSDSSSLPNTRKDDGNNIFSVQR